MTKKSGWVLVPAAFFLLLNFTVSSVQVLFVSRLIYFLFLIFLFLFLRRVNLEKILRLIVGGISTIIFLYGILQKFVLFPIYLRTLTPQDDFYTQAMITRIKGGRVFSIFPLPTLYAIICTVLVLFIFHYLITNSSSGKTQRLFWAFLLGLGLFNLVLTQSFGGIIYISAGGLVYLLLSGVLKPRYLIPVIMVLALFLSITIGLRYSEVKELGPIKLRFSNWTQAARIIQHHPLWGSGLGNYETEVAFHTLGSEAKSIYAHNFFLQFVAETGILFPLLLLLYLFMARKHFKIKEHHGKTIYLTVLVVMVLYNLIDIGLYFFSAGIITAIAVSQLYPVVVLREEHESLPAKTVFPSLTFGILVCLALLLLVETFSDNQRKTADFLKSQREYDNARSYYNRSIAINPFNYKAMTGYASLPDISPQQESEFSKAAGYLDRSIHLNPDSAFACYLKSKQLFDQKQYIGAFYFATAAREKNKLIDHYTIWQQFIKQNLEQALKEQRHPTPNDHRDSWNHRPQERIK